ncbi:PLDc N-terminal domain-containing protein [Lacinutrix salivirga]
MTHLGVVGPWQIIIILCVFIFPIIAIIDIVINEFKGKNDKLIWILIVLFFSLVGTLLYFIIGTKQKIKK